MTDDQLKQGQDIKRKIERLESEIEKFEKTTQDGINVFLPNCGTLIEDVRQVFVDHLSLFNKKFKEL